ncbi:MAG: ECF transporter S component [Candidatus Lokiarchaeota archaeon]|nr:ECF transporter S component [Candidatus Lokiarchaeota archaeon]
MSKNGENYDIKELKDTYRETGYSSKEKKRLTTLDLIYSAIIGVLGGIISSLVPFSLLIKVWYPLTGGTQLVSGHHVIWGVIVYGLTKNKNNILLTMVSKGILEFLLGDALGLLILIINIIEGVLLSFGFYIMEKLGEGESKLGWGIAGGIGNIFQAPFIWIIKQRWYLHWSLWALAIIFALISGILITGILGRTIKNGLIKAGVPTTF